MTSSGGGLWEQSFSQRVYTVHEFTSELKALLEDEYPSVKVSGEISNARRYSSGHWYFTLKDSRAQVSCVCFRHQARYLAADPEDGLEVVARGSVSVFSKRGQYQLKVSALEAKGRGRLQGQFERLKRKLEAEGLFEESRKRKLPPLPRRIGIVTSPTGAVIADMLRVLERRFPGLWIRLAPVRVQGMLAASEIAAGLRHFSDDPWADVVIVGRGGGPLEDLWAFNEERVARAIASSSVPVISAVGHQTDFTIADFVADLRAPTPSAAAELVVPEAAGFRNSLDGLKSRAAKSTRLLIERLKTKLLGAGAERAVRLVGRRIDAAWQELDAEDASLRRSQSERLGRLKSRLDGLQQRLRASDVRLRLARQAGRRSVLSARLQPAARRRLDMAAARLDPLERGLRASSPVVILNAGRAKLGAEDASLRRLQLGRLERLRVRLDSLHRGLRALSPVAILERGYAIVRKEDRSVVRRAGQVSVGESVGVALGEGAFVARVERIDG